MGAYRPDAGVFDVAPFLPGAQLHNAAGFHGTDELLCKVQAGQALIPSPQAKDGHLRAFWQAIAVQIPLAGGIEGQVFLRNHQTDLLWLSSVSGFAAYGLEEILPFVVISEKSVHGVPEGGSIGRLFLLFGPKSLLCLFVNEPAHTLQRKVFSAENTLPAARV